LKPSYGYTMVDECTAICPVLAVDGSWVLSGKDGACLMFEKDGDSKQVEVPFFDGGTCMVKCLSGHPVGEEAGGGQAEEAGPLTWWQMFPLPDGRGNRVISLSAVLVDGIWFAVAKVKEPQGLRG
jgi:hypothetical protein